MRNLLSRLVVLGLASLAFPAAGQGTRLYFNSQLGDFIGQGIRHTWDESEGSFGLSGTSAGVEVHFQGLDPGTWWYADFIAPGRTVLAPGTYEGAQRYPFQSPTRPGLSVTGSSRGCNTLTGRFTVLEIEIGPSNEVLKFAADFEQHCEGAPPALFGAVRHNSMLRIAPRLSVSNATTLEGQSGTHDLVFVVSLSDLTAQAVGVSYQTSDGTAVAPSDYLSRSGALTIPAGSSSATIAVPVVGDTDPEGMESFSLNLDAPMGGVQLGFSSGLGKLVDDEGPRTFLLLDSQPGDYIGRGLRQLLTPLDGNFTTSRVSNGVHVHFVGSTWWDVYLVAPYGAPLVPGVYEGATRHPFQAPSNPGLDVSGDGRGCNQLSGRFVVLEAVYGSDGQVQSFAADFEQHCENAVPALFGAVRINSTVAAGPSLSVGGASVYEGQSGTRELAMRVSLSAPSTAVVTVDYATADGTAQAGSDYAATSGTLTFAPGEVQKVVPVTVFGDQVTEGDEFLELNLAAPMGAPVGFSIGIGTIVDDEGPPTLLLVDSQPGDWIGLGLRQLYTPLDGTFTTSRVDGGVRVGFEGSWSWRLYLVAPYDAPLVPGIYEAATRWPFQSPTRPGLDVSAESRGCNQLSGRFTVLEAVYGAGGAVESFAADFEQHCENLPPALFGSIRINSNAVAVPRLSVSDTSIYEGQTGNRVAAFSVSLSAPATTTVTVNYATSNGTALAGSDYEATSGTLTFSPGELRKVVPVTVFADLLPEGTEFFLLGLSGASGAPILSASARGTILADEGPRTDLSLDGEPGEFVGGGQRLTLTPLDGTFTASRQGNAVRVALSTDTWWDLNFAAPFNAPLLPGVYEGATRYPFQDPSRPGLSVSGNGIGCNQLSGRFVVLEATYDGSGAVLAFAADFEQHCEGQVPALYGSVRYQSTADLRQWKPVGTGDFDGNGFADIVWRHDGDGRLSVWRLDPTNAYRAPGKPLNPWRLADTNWRVAGVGDLTLDGSPDVFWRHELTGGLVVWRMSGLTRLSGSYLDPQQLADLNWKPVALADMDGDGRTDILWQHALSSRAVVWLMNGTQRISGTFTNPAEPADTHWKLQAAGDFDGDGQADLLWRHDLSGALVAWLMDGLTRREGVFTDPDRFSNLDWRLAGTGYFNVDASRDLAWYERSTGRVRLWYMDHLSKTSEQDIGDNPFELRRPE